MRLVCPNCAAQYEVDEGAIPNSGRDVQCANCSNTWFQEHPLHPRDLPESEPSTEPSEAEADDAAVGGDDAGEEVADLPPSAPEPQDSDDTPDTAAPESRPLRKPTDPSVLDILRREAEHESARREADNRAPPEVAVPDSEDPEEDSLARRARAARSRLTAQRDEGERERRPNAVQEDHRPDDPDTPPHTERPEAVRPAVQPADTKEIKAAMRAAEQQVDARITANADTPQPRRGGRFGFYLAVLIALILLAAYALKPQIAAAVPGSEPTLDVFVSIVNSARAALGNLFQALIALVQGLLAEYL